MGDLITSLYDVYVSFAREDRTTVCIDRYVFFYRDKHLYICEYMYVDDDVGDDPVHGTCVFTGEYDERGRLVVRNMENGRRGILDKDECSFSVHLKMDGASIKFDGFYNMTKYAVTIKENVVRVEYEDRFNFSTFARLEYRRDGTKLRYAGVYDFKNHAPTFHIAEETKFKNDPDMDPLIDEVLANAKFVRGDDRTV